MCKLKRAKIWVALDFNKSYTNSAWRVKLLHVASVKTSWEMYCKILEFKIYNMYISTYKTQLSSNNRNHIHHKIQCITYFVFQNDRSWFEWLPVLVCWPSFIQGFYGNSHKKSHKRRKKLKLLNIFLKPPTKQCKICSPPKNTHTHTHLRTFLRQVNDLCQKMWARSIS